MLLFVLFAVSLSFSKTGTLIPNSLIDAVNSDPDLAWTAARSPIFDGLTQEDLHLFVIPEMLFRGSGSPYLAFSEENSHDLTDPLPTEFDTYTKWPGCVRHDKNLGNCGAFMATSIATTMSDRFCAAVAPHEASESPDLSPMPILSCDSEDYCCVDYYEQHPWQYVENQGLVTESCFPFNATPTYCPKCPSPKKCVDGSPWKAYRAKDVTRFATVDDIMKSLVEYGSVQAAFTVYQDFFSYKAGVYEHKVCLSPFPSSQFANAKFGSAVGGMVAKIQGYGVDKGSGLTYWNVEIPWGTEFGMDGYVWILKGKDECGIEDQVFAGIPA